MSKALKPNAPNRTTANKYLGGGPKIMTHAQEQLHRRLHVAGGIVNAVLQNPKVDQFCYGSPLDPHSCGGHPNVGEYLAHASYRLADQMCTAFDKIAADRAAENDPVPVPAAENDPVPVPAAENDPVPVPAAADAGPSDLFVVKDDQGDPRASEVIADTSTQSGEGDPGTSRDPDAK